jgi:hypothetical protein
MIRFLSILSAIAMVMNVSRGENAMAGMVLFDFADAGAMRGWEVENDVVMGGRSKSAVAHDAAGHLVFNGEVSLENDGGFASIQNHFDPIDVSKYTHAVMRLRGDGKSYRFIVEAEKNARHYYIAEFSTNGEWQEIKIPLRTMVPMRRGDRLEIPDYPGKTMAQARFMVANGRAEAFRLEVASIKLE